MVGGLLYAMYTAEKPNNAHFFAFIQTVAHYFFSAAPILSFAVV